jgi:hypothetical protein
VERPTGFIGCSDQAIENDSKLLQSVEPFEEIAARDAEWERRVPQPDEPFPDFEDDPDLPISKEAKEAIISVIQTMAEAPRESQLAMIRNDNRFDLALWRLLAIELALVAFQGSNGQYPESLMDLAPKLIPCVPLDPFSDYHFRYRRQGSSFLLYSIGPRGGNHEERFGSCLDVNFGDANLCLDVYDYLPACAWEPHRRRTPVVAVIAGAMDALRRFLLQDSRGSQG